MLNLLEALIGRTLLWRIARKAYLHTRREGSLDLAVNGETWLQRRFAERSARLRKPLTIVDVGANYGQWSSSMVQALRGAAAPRASLTLFEPVELVRQALAETAKGFADATNVRIEPLALSDYSGSAVMLVQELGSGVHHLQSEISDEPGEAATVEVHRLESYWRARRAGPIDLVKIDAEGFDPKVIAGMEELLAAGSVEVVQFEYGPLFVRTRAYLRDIFELGVRHGYLLGILHGRGIETLSEWHDDLERFYPSNMLLLRPSAAEWLGALPVCYGRYNTREPVGP